MATTKTTPRFIIEIAITLLVAFLFSAIVAFVLSFIMGSGAEAMMYLNSISGVVFGLIVGYKLSTLVRGRK